MSFSVLNVQMQEALKVDTPVIIGQVWNQTSASRAGLQPGWGVVKIDDILIHSLRDIERWCIATSGRAGDVNSSDGTATTTGRAGIRSVPRHGEVMARMRMNSRLMAAQILAEWLENGNFPERRLARLKRDRGFVMELVHGSLRQQAVMVWLEQRWVKRTP